MKSLFWTLCLLLAGFGSLAQKIPPKPNPPRLVNDLAAILTPEQEQYLEAMLVAYDDSTSIQIAVVTVKTLDDYEPIDYAVKLGRDWGVGNKKTNNGVILLVSTEPERRKVFIAPGYGMEGALPDITCKQIIENDILPNFRQQNYYRGIGQGVSRIMQAGIGEYKAPEGYRKRGGGDDGSGVGFLVMIIILIVIFILISRRGGGGNNNRGGTMTRRGYHDGIPPILWFPGGSGRGSGGGGWSGGGGGWSGGGGGFGGFGGGSFGGGGAGGSW